MLLRWGRLLLEFGVNQGFAQTAGMISGLIYVQFMSVDQYAVYALALSALSFLSVGSDLGLTGSIGYFWRQRLLGQGGVSLDSTIAAVRRLRLVLLALTAAIACVLLLRSAKAQHLSLGGVFLCFLVVLGTGWLQTGIAIDLLLVRIGGRLRQSYYCEAAGNIARLLTALAMIASGIGTALFGLLGGLLGAIATVAVLRSIIHPSTTRDSIKPDTWRELVSYVGPTLPTTIVYMIQDPLIYWLVFTVAGNAPLSETFAVGRIAMIYSVMISLIITVVAPKLANLLDDAHLARMAGLFLLALIAICGVVLSLAHFAPSAFLLLIGPKYSHLHDQLFLSLVGASLNLLMTFFVIVNRQQGWIRLEPVTAVVQLTAICTLVPLWPLRDSLATIGLMVTLTGIGLLTFVGTSVVGLFFPNMVKIQSPPVHAGLGRLQSSDH